YPEPELILRLGVRQADEALAGVTESGSGQHGDTCLVEQPARQLVLVESGALDVWKDIERALRSQAADAGDLVHAIYHQVAPVLEHLDHAVHRVLGLRS